MKKLLLLSSLILSITAMADNIEIRGGMQFKDKNPANNIKFKHSKTMKKGLDLAVEYKKELIPNLELGAGLMVGTSKFAVKDNHFNSYVDATKELLKNYTEPNLTGKKFESFNNHKTLKTVPIYLTAKYKFKNESQIKPYVKSNLGVAFNHGKINYGTTAKALVNGKDKLINEAKNVTKIEHGLYYGIGAGVEYKKFNVDLMFNEMRAKTKNDNSTYLFDKVDNHTNKSKFTNKNISLNVGYKLWEK